MRYFSKMRDDLREDKEPYTRREFLGLAAGMVVSGAVLGGAASWFLSRLPDIVVSGPYPAPPINPEDLFIGDMYGLRDETVPFEVVILNGADLQPFMEEILCKPCTVKPEKWLDAYVRNEELETFLRTWKERLKDDFIEQWTKDTNEYLAYLSGGKFQLALRNVRHIGPNYFNKQQPKPDVDTYDAFIFDLMKREGFKMVVRPHAHPYGLNNGGGVVELSVFDMQLDEGRRRYDPAGIHEILHGFWGPHHSSDPYSTSHVGNVKEYRPTIWLTKEEARHLQWPSVKPVQLHPVGIRLAPGNRLEMYRA